MFIQRYILFQLFYTQGFPPDPISETSEQKNSRAPILLSLYIGYVNAETLTLFGCGTAGIFSVKKASWGTRRVFKGTLCKKTGFSSTEGIFGAQNSLLRYATHHSEAFGAQNRLLWYGTDIRYRKHPPTVRNEATRCGHCVASSDPRMRPLRSGL